MRCTHYRCTIKQDSETPRSTKKRIFRFPNVFIIGFRRFRFPNGCAPDVIPIEEENKKKSEIYNFFSLVFYFHVIKQVFYFFLISSLFLYLSSSPFFFFFSISTNLLVMGKLSTVYINFLKWFNN